MRGIFIYVPVCLLFGLLCGNREIKYKDIASGKMKQIGDKIVNN